MFKHLNKRKGQSTLEYAVLIVIIIAALLAMNQYVKRGLQGRLKSSTDDIGDQFSPGNYNYSKTITVNSGSRQEFGLAGIGIQNTVETLDSTTITDATGNILNGQFEFMP